MIDARNMLTIREISYNPKQEHLSFELREQKDTQSRIRIEVDKHQAVVYRWQESLGSFAQGATTELEFEVFDSKFVVNVLPTWLTNITNHTADEIRFTSPFKNLNQIFRQLDGAQSNYKNYKDTGDEQQFRASNQQIEAARKLVQACGYTFAKNIFETENYPPAKDFNIEIAHGEHIQKLNELAHKFSEQAERQIELATGKLEQEKREMFESFGLAYEKFETNIEAAQAKVASLEAELAKKDVEITQFKETIKRELREELLGEEDNLTEKIDELRELIDEGEKKVQSELDTFERNTSLYARATQIAGTDRLIESFKDVQTGAAMSFFFFLAVFGGSAFYVTNLLLGSIQEGVDPSWPTIVLRLSAASLGIYFALFAGRQAIRSRNAYSHYQRLTVELSSLDAYLATQPQEVVDKIKLLMLGEYFGNAREAIKAEDLPEINQSAPARLISNVLQGVGGLIKGKPNKPTKAEARKEFGEKAAALLETELAPDSPKATEEEKPAS